VTHFLFPLAPNAPSTMSCISPNQSAAEIGDSKGDPLVISVIDGASDNTALFAEMKLVPSTLKIELTPRFRVVSQTVLFG
jgi:hypothetical protein